MTPTNRRMAALEDAAGKTARMLVAEARVEGLEVVIGSSPRYNWKEKRLYLPEYSAATARHSDPRLPNAFRGLRDHECAHVIFTDFDVVERAQEWWAAEWGQEEARRAFQLANTGEDIWIEHAYTRKYRGARRHFAAKNEYLVEYTGGARVTDPEFVPEGGKEPVGVFGAFSQAVLRVGRKAIDINEVHPETRKLMDHCEDEIRALWAATSTVEVCQAAGDVWRKLRETAEPPPEEQEDEDEQEGGESGEDEDESGGGGSEEEGEGELQPGAGDVVQGEPGEPGEGREGREGREGTEECPGGAGDVPSEDRECAAQAIGGDWVEIKSDAEVIASRYLAEMPPQYTVHPDAKRQDEVVTYDSAHRSHGRERLKTLEQAAGPAAQNLASLLSAAVAASRQSLVIGAQEEGDDLDPSALVDIALGMDTHAIYTTTVQEITESTYVAVLVDCSGSMGESEVARYCPTAACPQQMLASNKCPDCHAPARSAAASKSAYAAITAMALHKGLQQEQIPHAVLGYTTNRRICRNAGSSSNPWMANGYATWSRMTRGMQMHEFVPSPGIHDDGAALPYITGMAYNLDGESVMWAARYAAEHGGQYDRVILIVIADGLPAGADDARIEGQHLQQAVDRIAHAGIEVYGVGVGLSSFRVFSTYYPDRPATPQRAPTGAVEIPNGEGLTKPVLRKLTELLTRGYGRTRR